MKKAARQHPGILGSVTIGIALAANYITTDSIMASI
jgi:hypothetical protein